MVQRSVDEGRIEGQDRPFSCPTCGKTFRELRGLKGHQSGVHGERMGINATLQGFREQMARQAKALEDLLEVSRKRDVVGQRYVELAQQKAKEKRLGRCDGGVLNTELELLERVLKGASKG